MPARLRVVLPVLAAPAHVAHPRNKRRVVAGAPASPARHASLARLSRVATPYQRLRVAARIDMSRYRPYPRHSCFLMSAYLDQAEIEHYRREGWVVPRFRLPLEEISRLREALNDLIRANPSVRPEKLVSAHVQGDNGEGVRGDSRFLSLARDPRIVDLVSGVLGDDIILWGCHVFCKPAGDGYETPWHQDGHYWPIRPLANCTVWLALEESTVENGCLRVIPRSHLARELFEHLHEGRADLTLNQRLATGTFDPCNAVDIELEAGQMSLHDVYMIHGAAQNRSGKRRTGVALRYMPATSVFERHLRPAHGNTGVPVDFAHRPLWLVRGVDRSGRNDLVSGHRNGH
jgi:hypothetical protein